MTASKTARMGLMNPVGSDAFVTSDFSQTFGILDQNPGVLVVANAAARPTNYTAAQNGSLVYQSDLNVLWVWTQPNSGTVGQWTRVGTSGFLGQFSNSGTVSTSTTSYANGPQVCSGTVTLPGGRPILAMFSWDYITNGYGRTVLSYWENNVRIYDRPIFGYTGDITSGATWLYRNPAPVSSLSLTVKLTISTYNAAAPNGGGTSTISNGAMAVFEL